MNMSIIITTRSSLPCDETEDVESKLSKLAVCVLVELSLLVCANVPHEGHEALEETVPSLE